LSRLESFKPPAQAEAAKRALPKVVAQAQPGPKGKTPAATVHIPAHTADQGAEVDSEKTVLTFRSANELGKWLVDQIVDQAIMIDPGNWLALWTKYERVRNQGRSEDMKLIAAQLKHYYPTINLTPYLH